MNAAQVASAKASNNSIIERAIAAAKARRAAAESSAPEVDHDEVKPTKPSKAEKPAKEPKAPKAPKVEAAPEDKAAAKAARAAEREAKKTKLDAERAERKAARAEAKAQKDASKTSEKEGRLAHMKKVETAKSKLPALDKISATIFGDATANLSADQITALALHLQHHNRETATIRANTLPPLPLGATVRITGGEPKFIGMTGKVIHSQKLRAKVQVPGVSRIVYIYNGEANIVEEVAAAKAG